MVTTVQATIQTRIDAQQDHDAIEYAIRATRDGAFGKYPALALRAQHEAGRRVAERVLGHYIDQGDVRALRAAKKAAAGVLLAARDAEKTIGGKRQLRLALAA